MLHQESRIEFQVHDFAETPLESLSMIAYRSVAATAPTESALQHLLEASRARNRAAGITGVLVYDRGSYFQWLEGPAHSLQRLWSSISIDARHREVVVLREEPISARVFRDWDLRLAHGAQVSIEATVAAMESSNFQLRRVVDRPKVAADRSLQDVFVMSVIPRLLEVHGKEAVPFKSTASIWHADADSAARLAGVLLSPRAMDSSEFVDAMLDQGANLNALYKEVFEPAQLQLGRLWDQDLCDDFRLTIGLARLQMEIRRVNVALPAEHLYKPMRSVLLSPQLDEPHRLGLVMSCEVFERHGWDVICNMPGNDRVLNNLLHTQWFDVLKLSQSGAVRRDSRLPSIRATIDEARATSMNPSLIVIVDGRSFDEQPQIYRSVHANAMSGSAIDAAPIAERLVSATRTLTPTCLESVG